RSVIVSQANAALVGRLEVRDVDLWLLLGGAALKDVALHAENAAPTEAPLVAFRRLYVRVGWLPLLRRTLRVKDFALDGLAGHGIIEAKLGDGAVRIETTVTTRSDGFAVAARVDVTNLPLDRAQVHVPALGWSGLRGRLDAVLTASVEPGASPVLGGTLALRGLEVEVPGGEEPALAWRRLDLDVETLDMAARHALVRHVALEGAA